MVTLGRKIFNEYVEQSEELKSIKNHMRGLDESEKEVLKQALYLFTSQPAQTEKKDTTTARKMLRLITDHNIKIVTK